MGYGLRPINFIFAHWHPVRTPAPEGTKRPFHPSAFLRSLDGDQTSGAGKCPAKPWENIGKLWENRKIMGKYRKTMGKYRKTMGKYRKTMGKYRKTMGKYRKTMGNPLSKEVFMGKWPN